MIGETETSKKFVEEQRGRDAMNMMEKKPLPRQIISGLNVGSG
jgi:hypothetical protein